MSGPTINARVCRCDHARINCDECGDCSSYALRADFGRLRDSLDQKVRHYNQVCETLANADRAHAETMAALAAARAEVEALKLERDHLLLGVTDIAEGRTSEPRVQCLSMLKMRELGELPNVLATARLSAQLEMRERACEAVIRAAPDGLSEGSWAVDAVAAIRALHPSGPEET